MKIAVLTSSRADYGIYLPLLNGLKNDARFELEIIAFGTHLKKEFGYTIEQIQNDGFHVAHKIDNLLAGDSPKEITDSYANTVLLFSTFWNKHADFDWVLCLGDRFEMAAAVNAGIPFQIKFAHLHAGETTLGAIDNIYRHQITLASSLHFVSLPEYREKVEQLIGYKGTTEVIGSLSLLNLETLNLLSIDEFKEKLEHRFEFTINFSNYSSRTVQFNENENYAMELQKALLKLAKNYQIVVTLPNADTNGAIFRKMFFELENQNDSIKLIENFGTLSYFS
ncbi:MAG: UDP-N-acetylglucosamine 2-epimerase (hydrolyzing), partial [Flavobacteriales bacterium]|nr:UDP-N-acetylglucosamine 2-epimerase (hydrolyzing) [Flavobacteriales bacterium]